MDYAGVTGPTTKTLKGLCMLRFYHRLNCNAIKVLDVWFLCTKVKELN